MPPRAELLDATPAPVSTPPSPARPSFDSGGFFVPAAGAAPRPVPVVPPSPAAVPPPLSLRDEDYDFVSKPQSVTYLQDQGPEFDEANRQNRLMQNLIQDYGIRSDYAAAAKKFTNWSNEQITALQKLQDDNSYTPDQAARLAQKMGLGKLEGGVRSRRHYGGSASRVSRTSPWV